MMTLEQKRALNVGRSVAMALKERMAGTRLRVRMPRAATETNTNGWSVRIGSLGKKSVRLEIWLDRYARLGQPNLSACFWTASEDDLMLILRRIPRTLTPVRTIKNSDFEVIDQRGNCALKKRLPRTDFDMPIVEYYNNECGNYFGIYGLSNGISGRATENFCKHAVAFFEAVARAQRPVQEDKEQWREVYAHENRQRAISHVRRERSSLLAVQRKLKDDYQCRVCDFRFTDWYGNLGESFAEAHHLEALNSLKGRVINGLDDLITVCSNCHSMLHKMQGRPSDVAKLRRIVSNHRRRHR